MTFSGAAAATHGSRHRDALFPGSVDVGQVDLAAWLAILPNFLQTNSTIAVCMYVTILRSLPDRKLDPALEVKFIAACKLSKFLNFMTGIVNILFTKDDRRY